MKGKRMASKKEIRQQVQRQNVTQKENINIVRNEEPRVKRNFESKKKKKLWKKILIIILIIVVVLVGVIAGVGMWFVNDKLGKINYVEIDESKIEVNEGVELKGYKTIALFGVDSRYDDLVSGTRTDCIILATIDEAEKQVKLTSVYRDTYLEITGRSLDKVNHAYAYGGAELSLSTLNTNLDLDITQFVTVNFESVVDIVNAVGGVNMQITAEEVKYINPYIDEVNEVTKHNSSHITSAGNYNLDGVQALAYGRVRYTAGGDYKRTERMRDVLMGVFDKAKKMSISGLNTAADKVLSKIYTNINSSEILGLIPQIATYKITDSTGWPYKTQGATINGVWYGPPITLESNVKELHEKVYGQENYEVSDKVKEISKKIVNKTGYSN